MKEKEVAEIRRRMRHEKNNISNIHGCYVNEQGEIITKFSQSLPIMGEGESEKFLSLFKKVLSGKVDKNLLNIEFTTNQVMESEEHKLLMRLRDSSLKDEEAVDAFFAIVAQSVKLEDNYVILLANDIYDVPYNSKNDEGMSDASEEVFSYILCSICPVKTSKPALSYFAQDNEFHSRQTDRLVSPPELGFMFPSFEDRSANIYNALYYSKNTAMHHSGFADALFKQELPMPADMQKETFQEVLGASLADDCSFGIVQTVNEHLQQIIEVNKEDKTAPLEVSKDTVMQIFAEEDVPQERIETFSASFDERFGEETNLNTINIAVPKKIELKTADATVQVNADRSDLLETRIIDGRKYIMVRVEDTAELNGVPIYIK